EPCDITNLCFTGNPTELGPFLYAINDYLPSIAGQFVSEQHKINWVAQHFCYDPLRAATAHTQPPSYNWWLSLLKENALVQGLPLESNFLSSNPYVLLCLISLESFLEKLADNFSNRFAKDNMRKALFSCKQGDRSVGEYNAQFSSLAGSVDLSNESHCDLCRKGLNYKILDIAYRWDDFLLVENLEAIQQNQHHVASHHHIAPFQQHPSRIFQKPIQPVVLPDRTSPMDLDAVSSATAPTPYFRWLCFTRGVCFDCLQPYTPAHRIGPNRTCPNPKATAKEQSVFLNSLAKALAVIDSDTASGVVTNANRELVQELNAIDNDPSPQASNAPLGISSLSLEDEKSLSFLALQEAWESHTTDEPVNLAAVKVNFVDPS
ncbi:hypothetical protein O181_071433, partial [Austropuccinia psidii MF-1]|nr:hypothetical protein [Austropuccinia psidii MF-1]